VDWEEVAVLEFSTARNMGLWGSIAVVAGYLASFIPVLDLLGFVLMPMGAVLLLIAFYGLSRVYGDRGMFLYALEAIVLAVLSWILFLIFIVALALSLLGAIVGALKAVEALVEASGVALIFLMVTVPASALLWYMALRALSARSGVELFRWSATLYVTGALMFVAGFLLMSKAMEAGILVLSASWFANLLGYTLLAFGFSSLKPPATQAPPESTKPA
jgi:uncharacterized membrane protein